MDRNFELSSYQKDIINFVRTQRGNLLVDAKAGSGKTSTLIMIADELTATGNKCLFLAFNKHIVEELQQKITNTNCMIKTVHSLGFTFIKSFLYRKHNTHYVLEVDTSKLRNLVKDYYDNNFRNRLDIYNATGVCDVEGYDSDELDELSDGAMKLDDKELKDLHNNIISDFVGLCNFSRLYNINYKAMGSLDGLVEKFCWHLDKFKREIFPDYQDLIIAVIDKTKELFENPDLAPNGDPVYVVDYTDMLYFPVLYNMQIPYSIKDYLNTVMVDEAQDLSILQQKFIQKLQSNFNRFIFVGDKFQSIYAFAGADTHAIEKLDETFILQHLPLNICYRCPENVVRLAREIVPTIEWNASRTDKGEVKFLDMDDVVKFIQPNDVLIGRKNKDLLKLYRKFVLELKKPVKFRNRELVNNLIHSIEMVIMEYIKLYARGTNIFKPLIEHMTNFIKDTGCTRDDDLYEKEYKDYSKKLIDANTGKSNRVSKSNNTIAYLVKCMKEYKEFGEYGLNDDDVLTEYYDVIMDFIEDFKKKSAKILIDDFKLYLQRFLSGSEYDRVPIISSVHSMKGGEADNVYIFDYPLFPYKMGGNMSEDDEQQERNLKYVAVTRAKKNLYLVRCEPADERFIKANLESEATVDFLVNDCSIH